MVVAAVTGVAAIKLLRLGRRLDGHYCWAVGSGSWLAVLRPDNGFPCVACALCWNRQAIQVLWCILVDFPSSQGIIFAELNLEVKDVPKKEQQQRLKYEIMEYPAGLCCLVFSLFSTGVALGQLLGRFFRLSLGWGLTSTFAYPDWRNDLRGGKAF